MNRKEKDIYYVSSNDLKAGLKYSGWEEKNNEMKNDIKKHN